MTTPPPPPGDEAREASLVLSAERASATSARVPVERVRVRRVVVTEEVAITVAVRREVLRVEREPLPAADDAALNLREPRDPRDPVPADGAPWSLDLVLHEERPVVSLEVVPVERVHLAVTSRSEVVPVTTDLRREVASVEAASGLPGVMGVATADAALRAPQP